MQSTVQGFGHVSSENVFKVCDEPHPMLIKDMLDHCIKGKVDEAYLVSISLPLAIHFTVNYVQYYSDHVPLVRFGLCIGRYHFERLPSVS